MRAYCHIGHHKTGTTSLQDFLSSNVPQLLRAGIIYPWVETQGAAFAVASAAGRAKIPDVLPINIREAQNALAFRMLADSVTEWKVPSYHADLPHSRQMMLAIRNQIEQIAPDAIVLCSEVMSHFGKVRQDQISRLRKVALEDVEDITLWCTLRRPDEQLTSWHAQQVRFGMSPEPLSDPAKGLNLKWLHVDYRGVIAPWIEHIPEAEVKLRPYREVMAQGGSVEDFVKNSGIAFPKDMQPARRLNVSLPPAVVSLLREANAVLPKPAANELSGIMSLLSPGLDLASAKEVEFLGQASRDRLAAHFTPIHEWLSEISGRDRFFDDIEEMRACRPVPERVALRQLLDQLSPELFQLAKHSEIAGFIRSFREDFRP